jgi:cyclic pyranopterin phosphate synthase
MKLKIVTKEDLKDWTKDLFQEKSFNMIDVSDKEITLRRALATGSILVGKKSF